MSLLHNSNAIDAGGYNIERSLRFNPADTAYLNRTPASASNRKTWTWSGWIKKANQAFIDNSNQILFGAGTLGTYGVQSSMISFSSYSGTAGVNNSLRFATGIWAVSGDYDAASTSNYRDPSAWMHIVVAVDSTLATASDRVKLYVNGVQLTNMVGYAGRPTTASFDYSWAFNNTVAHYLGYFPGGGGDYVPFDGYMTEINFIDGQALTLSSFGETDAATGVWKPKKYTGTYGTNGFFLKFADNSGITAATLGKDSSGNGNNWTPNNFSVTAGAGNDSLVDTPTPYGTDTGVGGEVRGNYCTLNPLENPYGFTLSNGNLDIGPESAWRGTRATIGITSGKWYWEYIHTSATVGGGTGISTQTGYTWAQMLINQGGNYSGGWDYNYNGQKGNSGSYVSYGTSFTQNDVIGVAFDADAGTLTFYKNGTSQGIAYTGLTSGPYFPTDAGAFGGSNYNFGQRAFAYTAPSGFKALCTQNLPTPTIGATSSTQANDYFNVVLYTGNGSTQSISGVGFQPDFSWLKTRSHAYSHALVDAVRGATNQLQSNLVNAEITGGVSSFNSDGFTVNNNHNENNTGMTYVGWNWKANGAGVTNNSGTITSTVSASTTAGFSIVTYTGTGANATVGHGLGVAPKLIITKPRNSADNWISWHTALGATGYIYLNLTNASATGAAVWNSTLPSSTVFSIGTSSNINTNGQTQVAYCFAPIDGYSAFGSYTGNGSTDGPFVFTGFRPRWILLKNATTGGPGYDWFLYDSARDTYNVSVKELEPNLSVSEDQYGTSTTGVDLLSNGFKMRTSGAGFNGSGSTYIFAAFAESPFKYALAR